MKTYFAYGSNMDPARMLERCPSARVIGPAQLPDHCLDFSHTTHNQGGGVADIVRCTGQTVWGVLYQIPDAGWAKLCKAEGYVEGRHNRYNHYLPRSVTVEGDAACVLAIAFTVNPTPLPPQPTRQYIQHLVDGAIINHLPDDYIAKLEAQPTSN